MGGRDGGAVPNDAKAKGRPEAARLDLRDPRQERRQPRASHLTRRPVSRSSETAYDNSAPAEMNNTERMLVLRILRKCKS